MSKGPERAIRLRLSELAVYYITNKSYAQYDDPLAKDKDSASV